MTCCSQLAALRPFAVSYSLCMLPWSESSIGKYALVIEIGVTAPMSLGNCPCALGKLPNIVARPLPIRTCHGSLRLYQNRNISKPFVLLNLYSNTIARLNGKSAIRAQSVNTSQVIAQSVTRFSREDEESVLRCLRPLVSGSVLSVPLNAFETCCSPYNS